MDCGYSLEPPRRGGSRLAEAVLTSTHNLCFEQKCEKNISFLSENFQFLEVKFSIYLHMRVFVMMWLHCNMEIVSAIWTNVCYL